MNAARDGTLTFMVGGKPDEFEAAKELLQFMGKNLVNTGAVGTGQVSEPDTFSMKCHQNFSPNMKLLQKLLYFKNHFLFQELAKLAKFLEPLNISNDHNQSLFAICDALRSCWLINVSNLFLSLV